MSVRIEPHTDTGECHACGEASYGGWWATDSRDETVWFLCDDCYASGILWAAKQARYWQCKHERLNDHGDACLDCGSVQIDGKWQ